MVLLGNFDWLVTNYHSNFSTNDLKHRRVNNDYHVSSMVLSLKIPGILYIILFEDFYIDKLIRFFRRGKQVFLFWIIIFFFANKICFLLLKKILYDAVIFFVIILNDIKVDFKMFCFF